MAKVFTDDSEKTSFLLLSKLFKVWRSFDSVAALFSMSGIIFSTIDYEINYSPYRSYRHCDENYVHTEGLRYATALTTCVSLMFILLRYYYKDKWLNVLYKIKKDHLSGSKFLNEEHRRTKEILLECAVLCLFPYPYLTQTFLIPVRHHFNTHLTCYTISEVLYCFMMLRFFLILRAISNYTQFQNYISRLLCSKYKLKPNAFFSFKCLLVTYPYYVISFIFALLLFFATIIFRVFERPLDDFKQEYISNPFTALWFVLETASTMGFWDIYPFSIPGRTVSVITYLIGAIIFSLLILAMQKTTALDSSQDQVFQHIVKSKTAASVIRSGVRYFVGKKHFGQASGITIKFYFDLRREVAKFKNCKEGILTKDDDMGKHIKTLKREVERTGAQAKALSFELDRFISYFNQHF